MLSSCLIFVVFSVWKTRVDFGSNSLVSFLVELVWRYSTQLVRTNSSSLEQPYVGIVTQSILCPDMMLGYTAAHESKTMVPAQQTWNSKLKSEQSEKQKQKHPPKNTQKNNFKSPEGARVGQCAISSTFRLFIYSCSYTPFKCNPIL